MGFQQYGSYSQIHHKIGYKIEISVAADINNANAYNKYKQH